MLPSIPRTGEISSDKPTELDICVSWDASQIVVLDTFDPDRSAIYIRRNKKRACRTGTTESPKEEYVERILDSTIKKAPVQGTFHACPSSGIPLKKELFVAFDAINMAVYSVYGKWRLIWKSAVVHSKAPSPTSIDPDKKVNLQKSAVVHSKAPLPTSVYPGWKENLRGGRLVLLDKEREYISTRDLVTWKKPISARDLSTMVPACEIVHTCLSDCGTYFIVATLNLVVLYLPETWTKHGDWSLAMNEGMQRTISSAHFIKEGHRIRGIVVNTRPSSTAIIDSDGYVVSIETLETVERIRRGGLDHYVSTTSALETGHESMSMFLHKSQSVLGAIRYIDRLVRASAEAAKMCSAHCAPLDTFHIHSDRSCPVKVYDCKNGSRDRSKMVSTLTVDEQDLTLTDFTTMKFPLPSDSKLLGAQLCVLNNHSHLVVVFSTLVLVWKSSASPKDHYDLIWAEGLDTDAEQSSSTGECNSAKEWGLCHFQQLHLPRPATEVWTKNLLDMDIPNPKTFLEGIVRIVEIFGDLDEMSKRAIIRYVERHVNQSLDPGNDSTTIISHLCASWTADRHEYLLAFVTALFGSSSFWWIPRLSMDQRSNPISILIGHLNESLNVLDIVEIMLNYCMRLARVEGDLHLLIPITRSLKVALEYQGVDSSVFSRTLRCFTYLPAREYLFAANYHAFPNWLFSPNKDKDFYERKNPIIQLSAEPVDVPINERLTPKLYVASLDMLLSNEEIPISKNRFWACIQRCLLAITYTSSKRCVHHPFDLTDLDNPALIALIRYKWLTIGFPLWLLQTIFYGNLAAFFIFDVTLGMFNYSSGPLRYISGTMSWIFALSALRNLIVLNLILKKNRRESVYHVIEILTCVVPVITFLIKSEHSWTDVIGDELYSFILSIFIIAAFLQWAGMYEFVEEDIKKIDWRFHLLLTSFLFVATIMLNILFVLRYDIQKLSDKIYYTATPQQVRAYKLETQRLYKEAATATLPLEEDFQHGTKLSKLAIATEQEESVQEQGRGNEGEGQLQTGRALLGSQPQQRRQHLAEDWADQLKCDMRAEFKVELEGQLAEQKERMEEQSHRLMTQMEQQHEKLEAQIGRLLAALGSLAERTSESVSQGTELRSYGGHLLRILINRKKGPLQFELMTATTAFDAAALLAGSSRLLDILLPRLIMFLRLAKYLLRLDSTVLSLWLKSQVLLQKFLVP
ncbi:hypothetical protein BGZ70_009925 [Mortierella alpina]|uniref:Uncharacterized protein n=1 Tax=Mortierella alpina TaxID=64518 RepID=A0A9P6J0E2_MORAP|nr:hypothetical protein BGZ70_009925 [Mortierella alpina]